MAGNAYRTLIDIPFASAERFPDRIAQKYRGGDGFSTKTYAEFARQVRACAVGLRASGVAAGEHVAFFCNNRHEWGVIDFALMAVGAVSVPRAADTPAKEARFICEHAEATTLIVERLADLGAIASGLDSGWVRGFRLIVVIEDFDPAANLTAGGGAVPLSLLPAVAYRSLLEQGAAALAARPGLFAELASGRDPEDVVSIIYTSGTTGNPKGVVLSHRNFLQNVAANTPRIGLDPQHGDTTLVLLPPWHVFERAFEYCALSQGATFVFSSIKTFSADLERERPDVLISVPRLWESIYEKLGKHLATQPRARRVLFHRLVSLERRFMISTGHLRGAYLSYRRRGPLEKAGSWLFHLARAALLSPAHLAARAAFKPIRMKVGGRLRSAISGGGALPAHLDSFFNTVGIPLLNAYGMTECAPGILSRTFDRNTIGATGTPFANTEVRLLREDGTAAGIGEKGVLHVRGPQVMRGYHRNAAATAAVLGADGWLDTGDLAVLSESGDYVLVGRAKDTIVLAGGENVEPEPIEDKLRESTLIDHAVVLGQDQKSLAALLALNEEELARIAREHNVPLAEVLREGGGEIRNPTILDTVRREVNKLISRETGFKPFERIAHVIPVRNTFAIGQELTQTLKVKRRYVEERYRELIRRIFPPRS
jgi:long-chain acyl-CoA synthetase